MTESTAARKPRRSAGSKAAGTTGTKAAGTTGSKAGTGAKRTTRTTSTTRTAAKKGSETELVQLLTPEGERVETAENSPYAEYASYVADITPDELRDLYRDMVLTRRFDAEATALQRQGELGLWASLLGQEAAQIGSGRATREDDYVFPTYREHGVAWCRGVDPTNLLGMFRGVNNGGWDPNSNNFHLYTIVIGSQALHATGYAMGVAKDGADSGVIAYFGDGASSQGDVSEAFNFAAVYNAPVIFFCQNNQWAISESNEKQTRVPLYQRAQGFGFPGVRVDGNDVLACLAVTRWALERARRGEGPALIEAYTYRMGAHTTSDDPSRYRHDDERAAWEAKDPILRPAASWSPQTTRTRGSSRNWRRRARRWANECAKWSVPATATAPTSYDTTRETRVPVKGVRKATAAAMVGSAFTAPHVTEFVTVDVTRTMKLVEELKQDKEYAGLRVNPLLLIAKALLVAIKRNPDINASWDEAAQEIVVKHYVNLGIAAATPRGLIVPNIKDAHAQTLPQLAGSLGELVSTAREGKTSPAAMQGGTVTITNVGVFGVDTGTPILNPGESAILAVGAIKLQPWVHKGKVKPRRVTTLALSFDHRLVDGEPGLQGPRRRGGGPGAAQAVDQLGLRGTNRVDS
ncbi:hypothetical protein SVIOM342S_08242 [Streptomyces violaceorubidus]